MDKMIKCMVKGCTNTFKFTDSEQRFYASKGLVEPKRCKPCREKKRNTTSSTPPAAISLPSSGSTPQPSSMLYAKAGGSPKLRESQDTIVASEIDRLDKHVDSPAAILPASRMHEMDVPHQSSGSWPIPRLSSVFLVDIESVKPEIRDNRLQALPMPLSRYVSALKGLQNISQKNTELLADLFKREIEGIARFLSWVFFGVLHAHLMSRSPSSQVLRGTLAGWDVRTMKRKGDTTLLKTFGAGKTLEYTLHLAEELIAIDGNSFVARGARWFQQSEKLFQQLNNVRIDEKIAQGHSGDQLQAIMPGLNHSLDTLSKLGWVLIGHNEANGDLTALVGPNESSWIRLSNDSVALSNRINLEPLLQFQPATNTLDIFATTTIKNRKPTPTFISLNGKDEEHKPQVREASANEKVRITDYCPVERWGNECSKISKWNNSRDHRWDSQQYEFADVLKELPSELYGREDIFDTLVKSVIDGDNKGRNVILIEGEQGVGKTALVKALKKRLAGHIQCIPYFFIWNDGRSRCELTLFIEAASLAISRHRQTPLDPEKLKEPSQREKLFINLLQEEPQNTSSATTPPKSVVFIIDGLDILYSRNPEAVSQLLTLINTVRNPLLKWICLSRPLPDEIKALHIRDYVEEFTLKPLTKTESRELLDKERNKKAVMLPEANRLRLLDNGWIESALSSPDAGKPSYLLTVLNQVASGDSPANSQLEGFRRLIERLAPDSLEILALLAIVYAPISDQDIAAITFARVDEVRTTLLDESCFRPVQDRRWSIKTYDLRDYIVKCDSFDLPRLRKRALQWLIKWALNWENTGNLYALEFLPQHLQESIDTQEHDELRRLASSPKFLNAQRKAFPYRPEIPVNTIYRALVSSCKDTCLVEMFLFALQHAEVISLVSQPESIAKELQSKNYSRVSELATKVVPTEQDRIIWQLLAAIGAWTDGDLDAAQAIIYDIELLTNGLILRDSVAVALGHLASEASNTTLKVDNIIPKVPAHFLSDNGKLLFFLSLSSVTDGTALLQALPALEELQKPAILALARAIGRSGPDESAQNIADTYPLWADDILIAAIGGFLEVGQVKRARELLASISAPRRSAEEAHIRSAELRTFTQMSIQLASTSSAVGTKDVALAAHMSAEEGDRSALLERLISLLPRTHSEKEQKPWKWGKPRVVGEIAAALLRLDDHSGHRYFSWAENYLKEIGGRWHKEIAWGLVDLAQARLSLPDDNAAIEAETWISYARLVLQRTKKCPDRYLYRACDALAEAWSTMEVHCIPGAAEVLNEAHELAKLFGPPQQVYGLVEMAKREVRLGRIESAKETLATARTVYKESKGSKAKMGSKKERKERAEAQARYVDGLARCGFLDGLEDEIVWFAKDRVRDLLDVDDPLEIVGRAEVERRLRLADFAGATSALELIGNPDNRAKASRSIAVEYATRGRYDDALRMARDEIGAMRGGRRGERVPDVAHAIAMHVRENPDLRGAAREILKQLLVESSWYLDGTYRVVSDIIASQAFPELDPASLLKIAELVVGDVVFVDEGARKQL